MSDPPPASAPAAAEAVAQPAERTVEKSPTPPVEPERPASHSPDEDKPRRHHHHHHRHHRRCEDEEKRGDDAAEGRREDAAPPVPVREEKPPAKAEAPALIGSALPSARPRTHKGRRKIPIDFIDNSSRRGVTFSKRKKGVLKKNFELSILTGAHTLAVIMAPNKKVCPLYFFIHR